MSRSWLAVLLLSGCDRMEQRTPNAVTVRLPSPKTAAPRFAFNEEKKVRPRGFAKRSGRVTLRFESARFE